MIFFFGSALYIVKSRGEEMWLLLNVTCILVSCRSLKFRVYNKIEKMFVKQFIFLLCYYLVLGLPALKSFNLKLSFR